VTVATAAGIAAILRGRFSGASFLRRQLLDRFSWNLAGRGPLDTLYS